MRISKHTEYRNAMRDKIVKNSHHYTSVAVFFSEVQKQTFRNDRTGGRVETGERNTLRATRVWYVYQICPSNLLALNFGAQPH